MINHSRLATFGQSVLMPEQRTNRKSIHQDDSWIQVGVKLRQHASEVTFHFFGLSTKVWKNKVPLELRNVKEYRRLCILTVQKLTNERIDHLQRESIVLEKFLNEFEFGMKSRVGRANAKRSIEERGDSAVLQ